MASLREAFENETDAQSEFYREQQTRYQEVEPNRFLPDKMKGNLGPGIVNSALSQFDKYDPYSQTVSNRFSAAGLGDILQGQSDTTDQEEYCRGFLGQAGLQRLMAEIADEQKSPIRCGWRYKRSPGGGLPIVSQGALGTINGPLNAKADPLGNGVEWFWNLRKALKKHVDDYFVILPGTPEGLGVALQFNPNAAWCTQTNRYILVDAAGRPQPGYTCSSSSIVRDPSRFPTNVAPTAAASQANANAQQLVTCMTPGANSFLSRDCLLQAVRTQGCSTDGTLYQAIESSRSTASDYSTFLQRQPSYQTYQSKQGANAITRDLFRRDRGTWEAAIREIAKVQVASASASDPTTRIAARDLCSEAGAFDIYDFCADITDTAPFETVELRCIQKYWQEQNGKPAGLLYPSRKPLNPALGSLPTWGAYKQAINQLKEKTNSTNPIEQRQAIMNFLGVTVSTQAFSPSNLQLTDERTNVSMSASLRLWLDAKDGASISMDSSNRVATWGNKQPNGTSLSQPMVANRPIYRSSGFPGLEFNGTSSFMEIPNGADMVTRGGYTVYVVERRTSGKATNTFLGGTTVGQLNQNFVAGYLGADAVRFTNWMNDMDVRVPTFAGAQEPIRIWNFTTEQFQGRTLYLNGTLQKRDSVTARLGGWIGAAIGRYANFFYQGVLYEVLLYDTLHTQEARMKIEGYLAHKWGLQDSLPAGHLYKTTPP
jgi:hypothetical protein